jgi:hypothetical protein
MRCLRWYRIGFGLLILATWRLWIDAGAQRSLDLTSCVADQ